MSLLRFFDMSKVPGIETSESSSEDEIYESL